MKDARYKPMTALAMIALLLAGLYLSSCKSQENCAAYGEAKKFQVEKRR